MELPDGFWAKVDKNGPLWNGTPCWVWTAHRHPKGYGQFHWQGKYCRAHRLTYEALVGPIPPGMETDHLCRNRACVNPAHIEPVTRALNAQRGQNAQSLKTHCPQGHPYSAENTIIVPRGASSFRRCHACELERHARYRAQRKNK